MEAFRKLFVFVNKTKFRWLVPGLVIVILFMFINYFLANEGVLPFVYNIFSK